MLRIPVIGLCTGVQHNGGQIHFQKRHILYNKGIYANPIQLMYEFTTFFEFLVVQNGVDHNKNLRLEKVGIPHQFFDIFQRVGRIRTGTECLGSYIQGIRSRIDRHYTLCEVFGRSKYFNFFLHGEANVGNGSSKFKEESSKDLRQWFMVSG